MGFGDAIKSGFNNYATFSGRAQRSAFWLWILFVWLAGLAASILDSAIFGTDSAYPISSLFTLATLIPNLAIACRRLHDTNRSGWWQLLIIIPIVGFIILLIWYIQRGDNGDNRFGPDPLAGELQPIRT